MLIDKRDYDLIIFDLDGTLVNTDELYQQGWKRVLPKYNIEIPTSVLKSMNGQAIEKNNALLNSYVNDWEMTYLIRSEREQFVYDSIEEGKVQFKKGAEELLSILSNNHSFKLALATSSPNDRAHKIIKAMGIDKIIDYILCGDDVKNKKPAPDVYEKILKHFDVKAKRAIAIEDSISGIDSALNAGIEVIGIVDNDLTKKEYKDNHQVTLLSDMSFIEIN